MRTLNIFFCLALTAAVTGALSEHASGIETNKTPTLKRKSSGKGPRPVRVELPYDDGQAIVLGQAFDISRGEPLPSSCIEFGPEHQIDMNTTSFDFSEVFNNHQLTQKTNIKASAEYKGAWSAKVRFENLSSVKTSSTKHVSIATVRTLSHITMLKPWFELDGATHSIRLNKLGIITAKTKDKGRFRQNCGDGFIAQINFGGEFNGVFEMFSLTYDERKNIKGHLSGKSGVVFSGSFDAESDTEIENNLRKAKITAFIRGSKSTSFPTSIKDFIDSFKKFPTTVNGNERPISFLVIPYEHLAYEDDSVFEFFFSNPSRAERVILSLDSMRREIDTVIIEGSDPHAASSLYFNSTEAAPIPGYSYQQDKRRKIRLSMEKAYQDAVELFEECYLDPNSKCEGIGDRLRSLEKRELRFRALMPLPKSVFPKTAILMDITSSLKSKKPEVRLQGGLCQIAEANYFEQIVKRLPMYCGSYQMCLSVEEQKSLLKTTYSSVILDTFPEGSAEREDVLNGCPDKFNFGLTKSKTLKEEKYEALSIHEEGN